MVEDAGEAGDRPDLGKMTRTEREKLLFGARLRSSITGKWVKPTWWRMLPVVRFFYVAEK